MNENNTVSQTLGLGKNKSLGQRIRRWVIVLVVIGAVLAGVYYKFNRPNLDTPQFKTQEAIRGDLTVTVTATGNIAPTSEVEVGSELSGIIKKVTVDFNDRVKTGQPLVYLDDTRYQAAVLGARAALASAKAKLAQAQATVTQKQQNLNRLRRADTISGAKR